MTRHPKLVFDNEFYDGQLSRTLTAAYAGMADMGEAFATAREIAEPDPDRWYDGWFARAESVGRAAEAAADRATRRSAHLRASEYFRQSYFFLRHDLDDPRLQGAYRRHVDAFGQAAALLDVHVEELRFPYVPTARSGAGAVAEPITLKAFFFAPDGSGRPRPTVLSPCGYDSTAEEGYAYVTGALERGYNAICFEGPGQGEALNIHRLYFRPDWEAIVTPVVDRLLARPDVRGDALVLLGRSFAGYLAPRAAAFDQRLAALICDPAQPDMAAHLPGGLIGRMAGTVTSLQMRVSTDKHEMFGSRLAAHGLDTTEQYFSELHRYTMLDVADRITCPTLAVECEGDFVGGGGPALVAAVTSAPARLVQLTAAQGAGGHCAGLGQKVWESVVYGWLDDVLSRLGRAAGP